MLNVPAVVTLTAAVFGLCVGALAFLLGGSPRWSRYRILSASAWTASAFCALDVVCTLRVQPSTLTFALQLEGSLAVFYVILWHVYTDRYLKLRPRKWALALRAAVGLLAGAWLVPGLMYDGTTVEFEALGVVYHYPRATPAGGAAFAIEVLCLVPPLLRYVQAFRKGTEGAAIHIASVATVLATAAHDSFVGTGVWHGPFLLPFGVIASVGSLIVLLARSFVADARQLDHLTQHLEQVAADRTNELVDAEAALMRAEKLAALGRLSAGVAHEVNNPAAAVAGNIEYLRQELEAGRIPPDAIASIDDSLDAIDRIAKIVRQLLDLGRAATTAGPSTRTVSVSRAVQKALGTARTSFRPSITVTTTVSGELFARGDEAALVQVLVNLLVNAAQAIPTTRAEGKVAIAATGEGGRIVIAVTDDGTGMTEDTQRRLFDPFFTPKPFGEGTGLGLPLSLGIVRSIGGDLRVESRPGQTTMFVDLPASDAPSTSPTERLRLPGHRRTMLLVEDDDRVRTALARMLSSAFVLEVAPGVDAAVDRLRHETFDVVLSDWKMPDGGGRRLYEEIALRRPDLTKSVLFGTGGVLSDAVASFLEHHHAPVLQKPLVVEKLLDAIRRAESDASLRSAAPSNPP